MSVAGTAAQHTPAASDIELVHAARTQDDRAFAELYRRYRGPIEGFVRRYVRDDGRAEDVAQEAFVAALRRIRQTDCEIQFKPWIYEIARNAAIDHHRRGSRVQEVSFDVEGGLAPADNLRLTAAAAPDMSLIDKERFEHFRGALAELSERQHRIIVLRELEGLSYREIGERMQLSSPAVESALFRARRKLESEYEQLDTGRRCAVIRRLMARLAEGVESPGDRRRLDRHARRCWSCRRGTRQLGLDAAARSAPHRRAVALLPLPAFLRRLFPGGGPPGRGLASAGEAAGIVGSPAAETVVQGVHKAVVVMASVIAIGGGGATLGGVGPLAIHTPAAQPGGVRDPAQAAGAERRAARLKSSGTRSAGLRKQLDGAPKASPVGRPSTGRPPVSRPAPAPSTPSPRPTPPRPTALPRPDPGSVLAPIAGLKAPELPQGQNPRVPPARLPRLPRLQDPPALPALPADIGVVGGSVGAVVPDTKGATGPLTPP